MNASGTTILGGSSALCFCGRVRPVDDGKAQARQGEHLCMRGVRAGHRYAIVLHCH